jgi:bacterioferritin
MKGDPKILEHLQTAITMELTAVHQYLLHAHVVADWGIDELAAKFRSEMREELGHADNYMNRLMFLEGSPDVQTMRPVQRAQTLKDMFDADLRDELEARKFYTLAAQTAEKAGDLGTRDLFAATLKDEEGHIAWLEKQITLMQRLGETAYTQTLLADKTLADAET